MPRLVFMVNPVVTASVPPAKVSSSATTPPGVAPNAASAATEMAPPFTAVLPVKVLAVPSVNVPALLFVRLPSPLMTKLNVELVDWLTVSVPPPRARDPADPESPVIVALVWKFTCPALMVSAPKLLLALLSERVAAPSLVMAPFVSKPSIFVFASTVRLRVRLLRLTVPVLVKFRAPVPPLD